MIDLTQRIGGPVLTARDAGYATEIAGFNTVAVCTPEIVVGVTSAADVAAAVRFARAQGLRIHVQGAGHGGLVPVRSGMLVSTRRLDAVSIDADLATATIGAGARWSPVVVAAAEHGLAPIAGSSVTVGVVGYLLGGGLGPLARSHGFSSDYLLAATVVTGEGGLVEATERQNLDLFWALRGGRDGLGIVTEVRLRLVPLRTLYAGSLFFAEEHIEAALRAWIDWTATAHPQVTTSVALVRFPPIDVIPA